MAQGHPFSGLAGRIARFPGRLSTWLRPAGSWSAKRLTIVVSTVVVLAAIGIAAGLLTSSGGSTPAATRSRPTTTPGTSSTTRPTTTTHHAHPVAHRPSGPPTCPLTDLPPLHHHVPQRMLLAVKVGNNPTARPQSGLEQADIVFDTLAEGGITRYIAVYQCLGAPVVGPIRSVRWDDWHVLWEFRRAALSFVGGVIPNQNEIASIKWMCDLNDFLRPGLYYQNPARVRPDATYSSAARLWSVCPKAKPPPRPFQFSKSVQPGSSRTAGVEIAYSPYADVVWQWSAKNKAFLHGFREGGGVVPDVSAAGVRISARNVLIQVVRIRYGPFEESPGSTGDVESITVGHGAAYLLRNGRLVRGTWHHGSYGAMTKFVGPHGEQFQFDPGNTWIELVPIGVPIKFFR